MDRPIIQGPLDIDFYKFTTGQFIHHRYPDVQATFGFVNRSNVRLADCVDAGELREQLSEARKVVRFGNSDLHYLRGTNEYGERMFKEPYLGFLRDLRLPSYDLEVVDGNFRLEFSGVWAEVSYWETIALAIVAELYGRSLMKGLSRFERELVFAEGRMRLARKIRALRQYIDEVRASGAADDDPVITIVDFGTRRRFSFGWQREMVQTLAEELPQQFRGTSNVKLAADHNLLPMGTSPHEPQMIMAAIVGDDDEAVMASQQRFLDEWWDEYGWGLSIALPDTFGSDFFFRTARPDFARNWKGLRWDSGDAIDFGERAIRFYKDHGVDSREKLLIPSDGLEVDSIVKLARNFRGRITTSFGWGTNLTNDLGFKALSIVIKAMSANGRGTVKLSDNLAKATGRPEDIKRYKRIFGYTNAWREECRY